LVCASTGKTNIEMSNAAQNAAERNGTLNRDRDIMASAVKTILESG
jgi:hypothetical protein